MGVSRLLLMRRVLNLYMYYTTIHTFQEERRQTEIQMQGIKHVAKMGKTKSNRQNGRLERQTDAHFPTSQAVTPMPACQPTMGSSQSLRCECAQKRSHLRVHIHMYT